MGESRRRQFSLGLGPPQGYATGGLVAAVHVHAQVDAGAGAGGYVTMVDVQHIGVAPDAWEARRRTRRPASAGPRLVRLMRAMAVTAERGRARVPAEPAKVRAGVGDRLRGRTRKERCAWGIKPHFGQLS